MPKKKILVDQEFLDMVLKKITNLEKKIEEKPTTSVVTENSEENYIFNCSATSTAYGPEQKLEFDIEVNKFGEELKTLMKRYNFIRSAGEFLAKNIN